MLVLNRESKYLFSIIVPTYNYGHTLGRAIDSVLSQDCDDYEIVIIDDGSIDDTAVVAKRYCHKFPEKIAYFLQENQGPAAARNQGAEISSGEYLFFLDADDEMAEGLLKFLQNYIGKKGKVEVIVGDHIVVDSNGCSSYSVTRVLPKTREQCFSAYLAKQLNLSHCAKVVHHSVFDKVCYPIELRSSEDIPFVAHALALYDSEKISVPMAVVHKHDDSLRHNANYACQAGEKVVDYVFLSDLLPSWAKKYERAYRARRCLSVFRTLYLSGRKAESLGFYKRAFKLSPFLALKPSYFRKAFRAWRASVSS